MVVTQKDMGFARGGGFQRENTGEAEKKYRVILGALQ